MEGYDEHEEDANMSADSLGEGGNDGGNGGEEGVEPEQEQREQEQQEEEEGDGGEGGGGDESVGAAAPPSRPMGGASGLDAASEDILLSIPAFANASNRAIHEKVLVRYRQLARATAETRENQERASVMQEHLKHIQAELMAAQRVAESKSKELKTEEHLAAMAERALGRANQDLHSNDGKLEEMRGTLASVQAQISKGTERLEAFKTAMNWKQEELERWSAAAKQREEDVRALEEYTRSDEQAIRDLLREQERLTGAANAKRRELEREATETSAKQVELDKCAEEFRALHEERKELISRLEEALASIVSRDSEIAKQGGRHVALRQAMAAKAERIKEVGARLEVLERENREMEVRQEGVARQRGEARDRVISWTARVNNSRDELETLKGEVMGAAHELASRRAQNAQWEEEIVKRQAAVETAKAAAEEVKARRVAALAATSSVEEAVAKKDAWLKREAVRVEKMEKEVASMRDAVTLGKNTLAKLALEVETTQGEIKGAERANKNLRDRLNELDVAVTRQAEHSYTADFAIAQMEKKLARAAGEVSDEEKVRLTARIGELQKEVGEARALERQLNGECRGVKAALQKAIFARQAMEDRVLELQGEIDEKLIGVRAGEEALKLRVVEKDEALVSYDMLRVEVKRLRDALSVKSEEVLSLENRAAQLELSMEGRKKEVEAARTVQRMEAKLAEEERHRLALDFSDRTAKIALLKTRYEVLCAKLRGSEGEGGEPVSQAYFILKAAQRREELQREGDELEAAITRREKEVKALAHTLSYLNARNDSFREAFASVDPKGNEVGAVRALEEAVSQASESLYKAKRERERAVGALEEGERRLASLGDRIEALTQASGELEAAFAKAVDEKLQVGKAAGALEVRLDGARAKARLAKGVSGPTPDEIAIHAQALRDASGGVLFLLGQLGGAVPALSSSLAAAAKDRGLRLVTRPPWLRVGATPSSAAAPSSNGTTSVEELLATVPTPAATPSAPPPTTSASSSSSSAAAAAAAAGASDSASTSFTAATSSSAIPPVPRTPLRGLSAASGTSSLGGGVGRGGGRAPSPIVYSGGRGGAADTPLSSARPGKRPPLAAKQQQPVGGGKGGGGGGMGGGLGLSLGVRGQGLLKQ